MLRMLIVSKLNRVGKLIIQVLCSLIPLEPSRRCQHGFNMSFQLSSQWSKLLGIPKSLQASHLFSVFLIKMPNQAPPPHQCASGTSFDSPDSAPLEKYCCVVSPFSGGNHVGAGSDSTSCFSLVAKARP